MQLVTRLPIDENAYQEILSPGVFRPIVLAILVGIPIPVGFSILAGDVRSALILLGLGCFAVVAMVLSRRGQIRIAAIIVCLGIWAAGLLLPIEGGKGVHDIAILLFPPNLLLAGMTLRRREFQAFSALTCGSLCVVAAVGGTIIPATPVDEIWRSLVEAEIILLVTATGVHLLAGSLRKGFESAHEIRMTLGKSSKELEKHLAEKESLESELTRVLTEKDSLMQEIRRSEDRFRRLSEATSEGIAVTEGGTIREVNDQVTRMFGYSPGELIGRPIMDLVAPESRELVQAMIRDEKTGPYEHLALRKDGNIFPVEVRARMIPPEGPFARITAIYDLTERKAAEKQILASLHAKELLLQEVHHRVKNNLQVVSSLLSLEAQRSSDARTKALFLETKNRIRSMALVHEKLYRSADVGKIDFGEYLQSMTEELVRSTAKDGLACSFDVEKVFLGVDTAVPCGLLVHELVSNALTHAFAGRKTGNVQVGLRRRDAQHVELTIRDDGVGFQGDFRAMTSMGMTLVISLTAQIGGTVTMEKDGGTQFRITIPA